MRILLIEDDTTLGKTVKEGLHEKGYIVDWLEDGESAKFAIKKEQFDLVILDLGLPRILGLDLLQYMRSEGITLPVIILTARETLADKVEGFDNGADDFLTKPFELDELCARIRACSRRASGRANVTLQYKNIILDPAAHRVTLDGKHVNFPRREFALLHKLMESSGQVVSREHLMQSIYGWEKNVDSNALEVHIHSLRKKLRTDFIHTIRGIGYMVEKDDVDEGSDTTTEDA